MALLLLFAEKTTAQPGLEQYCYVEKDKANIWVRMIHYRTPRGWYAEGRYNYEAERSLSIYVGKEFTRKVRKGFARKSKLSMAVTPLAGIVVGDFRGLSAGLNLKLGYGKFFFGSQSQYTTSAETNALDFFFNWSELGCQPAPWIYFGLSVQHTYYDVLNINLFDPGAVIGFEIGRWAFPFYCFNIMEREKYFVWGITLNLEPGSINK